jgi:serine/threonine protein kinase
MKKLDRSWITVKKDYKLLYVLGQGSYGQVVKATHRVTKKIVAIKNIKCTFDDLTHMKYVLREITILRQLSLIKNIKSTTQLYEIMISEKGMTNMLLIKNIFLVMDYGHSDLEALMIK